MSEDFIDYSVLVDEAMHTIVKKSIEIVSNESFSGDHHFFISFLTSYPGVEISPKLKNKYAEEMTIVLQYQYENLIVYDEHFEVTLSFDNIKEKVVVPFKALTAFADPSVKFGLQFRHYEDDIDENDIELMEETIEKTLQSKIKDIKEDENEEEVIGVNNVVTLDNFRKKR